jgi:deoxyribodipyrimidine photo-lyase
MKKVSIYWSRRDFRLNDNPALVAALQDVSEERSFLPIFILEDYMLEANPKYQFGFPSRVFLSKALPMFAKNFKSFAILKGKAAKTIIELSKKYDIKVHVNEDIYPDFFTQIQKILKKNISVTVHKDMLSVEKNLRSGSGNVYSIFTPFKKAVWSSFIKEKTLPYANLNNINFLTENELKDLPNLINSNEKDIWDLFSKQRLLKVGKHILDLDKLTPQTKTLPIPYTNEKECLEAFKKYLKEHLVNYKEERDSLEKNQTSKMSLGLAWGLVSSRTLKQLVIEHFDNDFLDINWFKIPEQDLGPVNFLSELIWREFYKYIFFHNPKLMHEEFQERFRYRIEWAPEELALKRFTAWIKGETGYKIVDAAMNELNKTGLMHNRSRMIVSSVLTKNLGVDWRWGQEYFRATLLDLDETSNNGGWQWGASVGADPKPIRIFNPYLQAENYDKNGVYQKKWLGDEKYLFETEPLVPHKEAREAALKRYGLSSKKDGA